MTMPISSPDAGHPPPRWPPRAMRGGVPAEETMRKRYKRKRRSCALCKLHKRGWAKRWSEREDERLRRWERERADWLGNRKETRRGEA